MTVTIDLSPELETAARQHAARIGQELTTFVVEAVQEKIARTTSFDEVCAPIADALQSAGLTDTEVDEFFEEARQEVWRDKHGKPR